MSDLISRADAISVLDNFTQTDTLGHTPRQIVEALPSAQSEIIRCKDCAYWQREWSTEKNYHYCTMIDDRTGREFYCANAERREE